MKDKRILYVATFNPFIAGGGSQATRAYLDATIDIFGAEKVDVLINKNTVVLEQYAQVRFIEVPDRAGWKSKLYFLRGVLGSHAMPAVEYLKNHSTEYGWCIFNGGREAGWCYKRIKHLNIRKVTIHHNEEVEYCMDNNSIYTLGKLWPYTVRHEERNAYKYSDFNLFLTSQDMATFRKMFGETCGKNALLGTFDYRDREKESLTIENKDFDITISGSLKNYQTTVGVMDFRDRYLNIAKKMIPGLRVLLTGREPSQQILDMQQADDETFSIVANPEKILPVVQRGRIYLCPTCIGGGLKLRAMDGLKSGMPVLVHEVSSRGYDYFYDKPYFRIYRDELTFEKGLSDLLDFEKKFIVNDKTINMSEMINHDYYAYFGYEKGVERLRRALWGGVILFRQYFYLFNGYQPCQERRLAA